MQDTRAAQIAGGDVVRHMLSGLPYYTVPDDRLAMGASLGNSSLWVTTKGTGAIERVFSCDIGQSLINAVSIRYAGPGLYRSGLSADASEGADASSYLGLGQDMPGEFEIHPAFQRHRFSIAGGLEVSETTFLPLLCDCTAGGEPALVYQEVELRNTSALAHDLRVFGFARLRGTLPDDIEARYDETLHALVAHNRSRPEAVRVYGISVPPSGYATSIDFGRVYDPLHVCPLDNSVEANGDVLGCLQLDIHLDPGQTSRFSFIISASGGGEDQAIGTYRGATSSEDALNATLTYLADTLQRARVLTPDPLINDGALWSKVNMRRVMARYPQGPSFTNEPGVSSNVVGRDVAWFVYGNDHFMPDFSREILDAFARLQYPDGKIAEYYSALDGRVDDYGLNINDDTPLFVLAVNHHFRATGNVEWLRRIYPAVARAARYMVSQLDGRGLISCSARDPRGNVWAIAGWRNVIPNYTLNGAVTEINAECVAALRAAGHLATDAGRAEAEAAGFRDAAASLRLAMDAHLRNHDNGLYYLNIDADGHTHTDVTGDQIFPVMFRACDEETGFAIISRLNSPDFWTAAGLRTASRHDPLYDPSANVGLIGGVWPGLTWWYAFAAARYHPEFMVEALRSSFAHYAADPKTNNTVPGQFGEWFDGESLINRGMRLSPWEPPRFLWAAVEGVCGLMLTTGRPRVNPLVPAAWKWVALRRLPYHGKEITYFAARQNGSFRIYANTEIDTDDAAERYDEDVSEQVHVLSTSAQVVALRRAGEIVVLVGNVGTQTSVVPVTLQRLIGNDTTYDVRLYHSERGGWEPRQRATGADLCMLGLSIESHGYRIIELRYSPTDSGDTSSAPA